MAEFNWHNFADKKIREAIEKGEFSNLKGEGKPLGLDENPYEDDDKWAAHHLLKENGFTLPWIQQRNHIQSIHERALVPLKRTYDIYKDRRAFRDKDPQADEMWARAQADYKHQVTQINKLIDDYNLMAPSDSFRMMYIYATREIEKLLG